MYPHVVDLFLLGNRPPTPLPVELLILTEGWQDKCDRVLGGGGQRDTPATSQKITEICRNTSAATRSMTGGHSNGVTLRMPGWKSVAKNILYRDVCPLPEEGEDSLLTAPPVLWGKRSCYIPEAHSSRRYGPAARNWFSEKRTANTAKRRLLVNPYGPEIQTDVCYFLRENDLNSEKKRYSRIRS